MKIIERIVARSPLNRNTVYFVKEADGGGFIPVEVTPWGGSCTLPPAEPTREAANAAIFAHIRAMK